MSLSRCQIIYRQILIMRDIEEYSGLEVSENKSAKRAGASKGELAKLVAITVAVRIG
jgi:hypothetical protein